MKKSEKESELINTHAIMKTYINNLCLDFVSRKRELVLLADNLRTFKELSDHLFSLLQVFSHEYSETVKK